MISIELSPAVVRKLDIIHDHITSELKNPKAASETIERILRSLERLKLFPNSAPSISTLNNKVPAPFADIRMLICGNYIAFYEFCDSNIKVLQLYHASEDYVRYLFRS